MEERVKKSGGICSCRNFGGRYDGMSEWSGRGENPDGLCGQWNRGHWFYDSGRLVESGRGDEDRSCGDTVG